MPGSSVTGSTIGSLRQSSPAPTGFQVTMSTAVVNPPGGVVTRQWARLPDVSSDTPTGGGADGCRSRAT